MTRLLFCSGALLWITTLAPAAEGEPPVTERTGRRIETELESELDGMMEGAGKEAGLPPDPGKPDTRVRFIRLNHGGPGWDDGMAGKGGADENLLRFFRERTGNPVAETGEARPLRWLDEHRPAFAYITGTGAIPTTEADRAALREYLLSGAGLLFADAGSPAFDRAFQELMKQALPQKGLVAIGGDDPLLQKPFEFPRGVPPLWHHGGYVALGIRRGEHWCVFYHPGDLNDAWKTGNSGLPEEEARAAYQLGCNVIQYSGRIRRKEATESTAFVLREPKLSSSSVIASSQKEKTSPAQDEIPSDPGADANVLRELQDASFHRRTLDALDDAVRRGQADKPIEGAARGRAALRAEGTGAGSESTSIFGFGSEGEAPSADDKALTEEERAALWQKTEAETNAMLDAVFGEESPAPSKYGGNGSGGRAVGGWPSGVKDAPVRFIRLKHGGADWDDGMDMETRADMNFLDFFHNLTGFPVADQGEAHPIGRLSKYRKGFAPPFVYMTGTGAIPGVTEADVKALRAYLLGGGLLFADAGSPAWDKAFRAFIDTVFPDKRLEEIADDDPLFVQPFVLKEGAPPLWHHGGFRAMGVKHNGRWCVFYHPGDLNDAWKTGNSGLSKNVADHAMQMGVNLLYYSFRHYLELTRTYRK